MRASDFISGTYVDGSREEQSPIVAPERAMQLDGCWFWPGGSVRRTPWRTWPRTVRSVLVVLAGDAWSAEVNWNSTIVASGWSLRSACSAHWYQVAHGQLGRLRWMTVRMHPGLSSGTTAKPSARAALMSAGIHMPACESPTTATTCFEVGSPSRQILPVAWLPNLGWQPLGIS